MPIIDNPFGKLYSGKKYNSKLDAIYIPTLKNRPLPCTNLKWLLQYTKEIIFLFSEEKAEWATNRDNIKIITINDSAFYNDYKNRTVNINISNKWRPNFDIPIKRSYALSDARERNFQKILLLDDDIFMSKDNMVTGLSGIDNGMNIIGFHVVDYPDVSTIDHIERIIRKKSNYISMTGSCIFINIKRISGYFPLIYNEDLFFFLNQKDKSKIASGGFAKQKSYEPWLYPQRVRHEQFGDLIYEAIKRSFANNNYKINWEYEIEFRLSRINRLIELTENDLFKKSLLAAYEATKEITLNDINHFTTNYFTNITKF